MFIVSIFKAMDDCFSIRPFVPRDIYSFSSINGCGDVFWDVSIIWKNTPPIFILFYFTFITSVSHCSFFFTIQCRKKIPTIFFAKTIFKDTSSNHICDNRLYTIIFVVLLLDALTNYSLGSVRSIVLFDVHALLFLLVTADLGKHRCWRRVTVWCTWLDVTCAKQSP